MTTQEYVESLTDEECDQALIELEQSLDPDVTATNPQVDLWTLIARRIWLRHLLALLRA